MGQGAIQTRPLWRTRCCTQSSPEDVFAGFFEVGKENWSLVSGDAQHLDERRESDDSLALLLSIQHFFTQRIARHAGRTIRALRYYARRL
jgi:hypothetical protein